MKSLNEQFMGQTTALTCTFMINNRVYYTAFKRLAFGLLGPTPVSPGRKSSRRLASVLEAGGLAGRQKGSDPFSAFSGTARRKVNARECAIGNIGIISLTFGETSGHNNGIGKSELEEGN